MKRTSAMYGVVFLSATNLFLQALGFFYRMMLSRSAGAEGLGMFSLLMPVYSLMMACVLPGLTVAVSAMATRAWTWRKPGELKAVVTASRRLFYLGYGILFLIIFPMAEPIAACLLGDASLKKAIRLLLFCFLFSGAESTKKAALMATKQIEKPFFSELTEQAVRFISVYLFLKRATSTIGSVEAIVYGMAVSELFGGMALHLLYHKAFLGKSEKIKKSFYNEILNTAIPVNASGVASSLLRAMISSWLPTGLIMFGLTRQEALRQIGALTMASSVTMFPTVFVGAVGNILMQRLNGAAAKAACTDIHCMLSRAFHSVMCITFSALCVYLLWGRKLCFFIYQNETAAELIPSFAFLSVLTCFSMLLHSAQNGLGLQVKSAVSELTAMLICCAADLWLVPYLGIKGYMLGMFLSEIYDLTESVIRVKSMQRHTFSEFA